MTIQNTTIRKAGPSQGNGVTTVFPFTFKVFTASEILVTYLDASGVESVLVLSTNYTVSLNADQNASPGGSVTLLVAPATATYITLTSQVTNTQNLNLTNSGGFYPQSINDALDRTVIEIQQLAEQASRSITIPKSSTASPLLPIPTPLNVLAWNIDGTAITNVSLESSSNLSSYKATGTGSVTRTVASKLNDTVSVKDFGAVGDAVTDDTAAIQAAMNSGATSIYFPYGTYVVSSAINIPSTRNLYGDGPVNSTILTNSATANIFNINTPYACGFTNLRFTTAVTRTGGSYIQGPSSIINTFSIVHRCEFVAPYIAINMQNMVQFEISNCYIVAYGVAGVIVSCPLSPDSGDSAIFACVFDGASSTGTAIYQASSGGLRVTNNKFLGGDYHYLGMYDSGAIGTSILLLQNNSSENAIISNFAFNEIGNTSFASVIITGNQITIAASASAISVIDTGIVWMTQMVIGANTINLWNSSVGINIGRMFRGSIYTNSFFGNGTLITGITFAAGANPVTVYPQDFFNVATPYAGTLTGITFTADTGAFTTLTSSSDALINGINVGKGGGASLFNTALGFNTLASNSATSYYNTAIGYNTLASNVLGANSTVTGWAALQSSTTAIATFGTITAGSGYTNGSYTNIQLTYVSGSTAGTYPLVNITVAGGVVTACTLVVAANGTSGGAGFKDITTVMSCANTIIGGGVGSGFAISPATLVSGGSNCGFGSQALTVNTTGINNCAMGTYALLGNTVGSSNAAVGNQAMFTNQTGSTNSAFGNFALRLNVSGSSNSAFGNVALNAVTGSSNTGIGAGAGSSITTGSNNVVIGGYTGSAAPISATGSNYIVVSDGAANVRQTIDPNGHAIFGATTRTAGYLVAALPTGVTGMRAYVTNALSPVFGSTVVTGGAVTVPVFYNGSNWIVG